MGFERSIQQYTWKPLEKIEIEAISYHLEATRETLKNLEKEIIEVVRKLVNSRIFPL